MTSHLPIFLSQQALAMKPLLITVALPGLFTVLQGRLLPSAFKLFLLHNCGYQTFYPFFSFGKKWYELHLGDASTEILTILERGEPIGTKFHLFPLGRKKPPSTPNEAEYQSYRRVTA